MCFFHYFISSHDSLSYHSFNISSCKSRRNSTYNSWHETVEQRPLYKQQIDISNGKMNCWWPDCYLGAALSYLRLLYQGRLFPIIMGKLVRVWHLLSASQRKYAQWPAATKRKSTHFLVSALCESQHLPYENHERLSEDKVITSYVYSNIYPTATIHVQLYTVAAFYVDTQSGQR